jgi:hypothetical protein
MTTTFRALCAELVETWDATADFDFNDFGNAPADIVNRTRAALAQPEPVAPTEMELIMPIIWMLDGSIYYNDKGDIAQSLRELVARWGHCPMTDRQQESY